MKITTIIGSPRPEGFGGSIEKALLGLLGEAGRKAKTFTLNSLTYRGCQACMSCKTTADACVQKDDLTPILADIRASDVVIVSAPIYMGEVNAQAKGLLDRFYSYLGPDFRTNPKSGRLAPEEDGLHHDPGQSRRGDILRRPGPAQADIRHVRIHGCASGPDLRGPAGERSGSRKESRGPPGRRGQGSPRPAPRTGERP